MAKQYDILIRLLMIGDSGVGKTCMLCRFADDDSDEISQTHISTIGIDFKMKTLKVDDKKIRIQIWDTAGQERYETITKQYYRRAQGVVVVYDISNETSFLNIKKWIDLVSNCASEDTEIMLVGNKNDSRQRRVITKERGEELAKELKVPFYETSAFNDTNIDEVFIELAKIVMKRNKREIEKQMEHIKLFCREDSEANIIDIPAKEDSGLCCTLM
ncbi:ras-related protein Rab-15-like isoform X2 [Ptychodera flava]|uniref:ras-related protein Rab-15-like isoform X2 n=1 Tax=Ptychodera flava TaxID=63121 RepID=UPI00396A156E